MSEKPLPGELRRGYFLIMPFDPLQKVWQEFAPFALPTPHAAQAIVSWVQAARQSQQPADLALVVRVLEFVSDVCQSAEGDDFRAAFGQLLVVLQDIRDADLQKP